MARSATIRIAWISTRASRPSWSRPSDSNFYASGAVEEKWKGLGPAGLIERLSAGLLPFLSTWRGYVARWDQIDITEQERPRLRCPVEELQQSSR